MNPKLNRAGNLLVGIALLLAGVSVVNARLGPTRLKGGPEIEVRPVVADLGVMAPGTERRVSFDLVNRTGRRFDVVGAASICKGTACLMVEESSARLEIPASGSVRLWMKVQALTEGEFDAAAQVFVTSSDRVRIPLAVRTRVAAPAVGNQIVRP